jgi:lipopolysaccharide export system protein LptA
MTGLSSLIVTFVLAPLLAAPPAQEKLLGDGPLEFTCKRMRIESEPTYRVICLDDVVVLRGDLLVCCERFEGFADAQQAWERFTCTNGVRAQRGDENMWSDKADFIVETSELTLSGKPRLHRGKSILEGTRIVVDVRNDRARVENPRGRLESIKSDVLHSKELPIDGKLPDRCPLPPIPTALHK